MNSFNDNELDRWLRQSAGQGPEQPAPDGWDTPPEDVWEQLRAGLDQRRKRRRLFWAAWFFAVIGLAGIAWYAGSTAFTPSRPQPFRAEENIPQIKDSPNTPSSFGENKKLQHHFKDAKIETGRPSLTISEGVENDVLAAQKEITPPVINGRDRLSGVLGVLSDNSGPAAGAKAYVAPAPGPDIAPMKSLPTPFPDERPASTVMSAPGHSRISGTGMSNAQTARTAVGAPVPLPVAPAPLPGKPAYAPFLNLPPVSALIRPQKDHPSVYSGLATGVFFTTRKLKHTGTDAPNGQESGGWIWQQGLSLGWKFHRRWAIESGLQRTAIHLQAERQLQFRYRLHQEQFDQQRFLYQNTANDVMETSFGAVEMRMDVGREPSRPINDLAVFRVVLRTDEQARYWRVPLTLRWSPAARGPWQWNLAGGIGLNFSDGYELRMAAARANRPGIRGISARLSGNANGLAPMTTDLQFGGQLAYRLSRRCALSLSPEFRYGLSPMYRSGPFRSLAVSGGVQAGLFLYFK